MKSKTRFLIILFMLSVCQSFGQTKNEEFRKAMYDLNKAYIAIFPCKSEVVYNYYSDYTKAPDFSYRNDLYSGLNMECSKSDEVETFRFDTLEVFINHKEMVVSVGKVEKVENNFPGNFLLDSMWHIIEKVEVKEFSSTKRYSLFMKEAVFSKIDFEVSKSTGLLTSIKLYVNDQAMSEYSKAMLEVKIISTQKNTPFEPKGELKNKIQISQGGKVSLMGSLKSYQLITPIVE